MRDGLASRATLNKITSFNVSINGKALKRVNVTKCLGVLIDEELNWSKHVDKSDKGYAKKCQCHKTGKGLFTINIFKVAV